ncbi:glycoside hydrolase family protein [Ideonella sp. NS12-5]|uniref:Glycoside hydrolase family protein n=1 Tax=Ideonella oryzae TaxID=2937441 RepID=A0ABT1BSS6_9BURK|nr:glycoside hydrolase family protein [Ideonella oryzae]
MQPSGGDSATLRGRYGMEFVPMLWNGSFDDAQVLQALRDDPGIRHLLVLNEPNLSDQANLTPDQAAALWPRFEAIAQATGVQIIGPQITWGTLAGYADPVVWLDAFYATYRGANAGRDPHIDGLGFHWYDYGLADQLDRLTKYGKPFWVTEMANWHSGDGDAQIDSSAKQQAQMSDMVATCEARADVLRYAWFTGRWSPDPHFTSVLAAAGTLTELGQHYLSLPYASS